MDIYKFDFTKFTNGKWKEVLTYLFDDPFFHIDKAWLSSADGEPSVILYYSEGDDRDYNKESQTLIFTAFDINVNNKRLFSLWRKFMFHEFGEDYREALLDYLHGQIQQINDI